MKLANDWIEHEAHYQKHELVLPPQSERRLFRIRCADDGQLHLVQATSSQDILKHHPLSVRHTNRLADGTFLDVPFIVNDHDQAQLLCDILEDDLGVTDIRITRAGTRIQVEAAGSLAGSNEQHVRALTQYLQARGIDPKEYPASSHARRFRNARVQHHQELLGMESQQLTDYLHTQAGVGQDAQVIVQALQDGGDWPSVYVQYLDRIALASTRVVIQPEATLCTNPVIYTTGSLCKRAPVEVLA